MWCKFVVGVAVLAQRVDEVSAADRLSIRVQGSGLAHCQGLEPLMFSSRVEPSSFGVGAVISRMAEV